MRQTRRRDDFVNGIGLEVQRPEIQANLPRNRPNLHPVYRGDESFVIESVLDSAELMQFRDLPQHDSRNTPFRIFGEDVSLVWCETSVERFDQNMSVQIQHPKQLQSKRDRPVDSIQDLS